MRRTLARLWPYLWPAGRPDLQRRVFLAFGLLIVAKLVTILMPYSFKWATDAIVMAIGVNPAASTAAPASASGSPPRCIGYGARPSFSPWSTASCGRRWRC